MPIIISGTNWPYINLLRHWPTKRLKNRRLVSLRTTHRALKMRAVNTSREVEKNKLKSKYKFIFVSESKIKRRNEGENKGTCWLIK